MEDKMTVTYNGKEYEAIYNPLSGYYETIIDEAVETTNAHIEYTDLLDDKYELDQQIQTYPKQPEELETDKIFMWILEDKTFEIKDVIELMDDYEINIDEETNANSIVNAAKATDAKADDTVMIKRNGKVIYWGIIDNIVNNENIYQYTLKYILNMFDKKIPLSHNAGGVVDGTFRSGYYVIKSGVDPNKVLDVYGAQKEDRTNIQIWTRNDTDAQLWYIQFQKYLGYYTLEARCSGKRMDIQSQDIQDRTNIYQYKPWPLDDHQNIEAQLFILQVLESPYVQIVSHKNEGYAVDVQDANPAEGNNVWLYHVNGTIAQKFILERIDELDIKDLSIGLEGHIKYMIEEYWINNFVHDYKEVIYPYTLTPLIHLEVNDKTNTAKNTTISNVNDNQFNLKTWMNNCTKLYNIRYNFSIKGGIIELNEMGLPTKEVNCNTLVMDIENKSQSKQIIDLTNAKISNYEETYDTNIVSCVYVFTNTQAYKLVLKRDRTTVEWDEDDRAQGETEYIYTKNYEDARQKALDVIQSNSYNHNISFDMVGDLIPVGTPVAIKTPSGNVVDTYVSGVKITKSKAISYTFGNIRIDFLDKLRKERENR